MLACIMEQAPPPPQQPAPLSYRRAERAADTPDNCYRCGYPLLGIADEQACPECGLLARRSRRTTDELHNTRPRWLARVSRGANLILCAVLIAAAWQMVWGRPFEVTYRPMGRTLLWYGAPWAGLVAAAVLLALGAWMLAGKEGYPPADRADRRLRMLLRLAASVPLLALGVAVVRDMLDFFVLVRGTRMELWMLLGYLVWGLATLGCVPLPLLLFLHLRGLAKRARSAHLAEHCLIVGVGTTAAILFYAAYAVVMANARAWGLGTWWTSRSNVAFVMLLTVAVSGTLFTLWSLYLFVRFVLAFRRAARELRGTWRDDDRSLDPPPATDPASLWP